jgi:hypothetical protein
MFHQLCIRKPTIGAQDHLTLPWKQGGHLVQDIFVACIGDTTARMLQNFPHHGDRSPTLDARDANHTVRIPQG